MRSRTATADIKLDVIIVANMSLDEARQTRDRLALGDALYAPLHAAIMDAEKITITR